MISAGQLRRALQAGQHRQSSLFPELRDPESMGWIKLHPYTSRIVQEVHRQAPEAARERPEPITLDLFLDFQRTGSRVRYDRAYSRRLETLSVLLMETLLTETDDYVPEIEERLWELCGLYSWELSAHLTYEVGAYSKSRPDPYETVGLLAAETAFQLAETLYLIGHKLHPLLVRRVRKELFARVLVPFRERLIWWETSGANWASVCAGSIGCAALYLMEDQDELCVYLGKVLQALQSYLDGFDRDGVTTEGLLYWGYGFDSFVFFAELLRDRTDSRISLLEQIPKIRSIAAFPASVMLSGGQTVNFSDCPEGGGVSPYMAARLRRRTGVGGYGMTREQMENGRISVYSRWAYLSRGMVWAADNEPQEEVEPALGLFHFPESQWLIDKRLDEQGRLIAFAAKGGHNDEPHNHNDLGHFILHIGGKNVLPDIGSPQYTKEFFSSARYDHIAASSFGHSVPVLNGKHQAPGLQHRAVELASGREGEATVFRLQLKEAYDLPELESFEREWRWLGPARELELRDRFRFAGSGNRIEESIISRDEPILVEAGLIRIDAGVCSLEIAFDPGAVCTINKHAYLLRDDTQSAVYRIGIAYEHIGETSEQRIQIRVMD